MTSNASSKPNGDIDWQNNNDNWTETDAEWLNERAIVRVSALPTAGGTPSRLVDDSVVRNINAGRVFYNTTSKTLSLSTITGDSAGYKSILASSNISQPIDSSTDVVLKVGSYGITLKNGVFPIVLDRIDTLTVSTGGINTAVVTTSSTGVEVDKAIRIAAGTTILSGTSVASTTVTASGAVTGRTLVSTVGTGTAPFTVASGTVVPNLNADKLDGLDADTLQNLSSATGTLTTSKGGTGITTNPTVGGVAYGATTSTYGVTAAGVTGQVITSTGASAPTWQYPDLYTCTFGSRPAFPAIGQSIYETDTGNFLIYYGATTGWRLPWNQPWGIIQIMTAPTDQTLSSTTIADMPGTGGLADGVYMSTLANRWYRATLSMYVTGNATTLNRFTSLLLTKGDGTQLASFAPQSIAALNHVSYCSTTTFVNPSTINMYVKVRYSLNNSSAITLKGGSGVNSVSELIIEDLGPATSAPPSV
jgi:hypothetical protein